MGWRCWLPLLLAAWNGVHAAPPAVPPPLRFEIPVVAGRVRSSIPLTLHLRPPGSDGAVQLEGRAELAALDRQLVALLRAALGPRSECQLQIDLRRAWLSVAAPDRVRLDLRGRVMQPLCGKLRQVLGGPLEGPSSTALAAIGVRLLADGEGRPVVWVEQVEMSTGKRDLDRLLHAWRPPEAIRLDLQARLDEALAAWPPTALAGFRPRLRWIRMEQGRDGALVLRFEGGFQVGWKDWLDWLGRESTAASPGS